MAIRFRCTCGKVLVTADEHAGKRTKCPACGQPVAVPAQPAPDGESLRLDDESHEQPLGLQEEADSETSAPLTADEMLKGLRWRGAPKRRSRAGRRRSARRLGPIAVKLAPIALVIVIGVVLWRMEVGRWLWGKVAGRAPWAKSELTVSPYRTTRSLPAIGVKILGATEQAKITPTSPDAVFLVVPIELPRRYLVPFEEEYKKLLKEQEHFDKKMAQKSPRSAPARAKTPGRECTMVFDPSRFTLILPNGRRRAGDLIHVAMGGEDMLVGGFSPHCIRYSREPIDVDGEEAIEVAWALDRADCKPPFKVQLDSNKPLPVPSK